MTTERINQIDESIKEATNACCSYFEDSVEYFVWDNLRKERKSNAVEEADEWIRFLSDEIEFLETITDDGWKLSNDRLEELKADLKQWQTKREEWSQ